MTPIERDIHALVDEIRARPTFAEVRGRLGAALGLDGPTTPEAAARFLADGTFARTLIGVRHQAPWRDRMLTDAMNAEFSAPLAADPEQDARPPEAVAALALKAANAYIEWSHDGFRAVDPEILARRRAACLGCDQLTEAPQTLAYSLAATLSDGDRRMCAACGCLFAKKIKMPRERCPLAAPDDADRSRWGDPIAESA